MKNMSLIIDILLVCTFTKHAQYGLRSKLDAQHHQEMQSTISFNQRKKASSVSNRADIASDPASDPSPCSGGNDDGGSVRDRPKAIRPLLLSL